jgi:peroxiredoxin
LSIQDGYVIKEKVRRKPGQDGGKMKAGKQMVWGAVGLAGILFLGILIPGPVRAQGRGSGSIFQSYGKPLPLPDFSLEDLQGKKVRAREYRGKVVILNFWATWCPGCRAEAASLEKLYGRFHSKGLVVFRVNTKESQETVNKFLEQNPSSIPVLLDKKNKVGKMLGVWVHPTSYIVDSKGLLQYRAMGAADWGGIEGVSIVERLLGEI